MKIERVKNIGNNIYVFCFRQEKKKDINPVIIEIRPGNKQIKEMVIREIIKKGAAYVVMKASSPKEAISFFMSSFKKIKIRDGAMDVTDDTRIITIERDDGPDKIRKIINKFLE
ncbi:hypothetical protein J7J81_02000 [bacterium]|nr:hypothetical protein [bacterium]